MNSLDIVIGVIVGFCLIRGIFRGIIKETTSIVGVFVGFYGAFYHYALVASIISHLVTNKSYLNIVSIVITFTVLFLVVGFIGVVLKHLLKTLELGWADRVLGGIFGLIKAVLIASVLLVPLAAFLPKEASLVRNSFLAPYIMTISEKIVLVVPKEMKEKFADNIKPLKEAWKK